MKSAIVPAQITTVEDKITGNLSLTQLLLLAAAVFGDSAVYVLVPPVSDSSPFKLVFITVLTVMLGLFAIRLKGKLLLQWAIVLLRYSLRPRFHVFNKNDLYLRPVVKVASPEGKQKKAAQKAITSPVAVPQLSTAEKIRLEGIIADPQANFHLTTGRKGALHVRINEIKQESVV